MSQKQACFPFFRPPSRRRPPEPFEKQIDAVLKALQSGKPLPQPYEGLRVFGFTGTSSPWWRIGTALCLAAQKDPDAFRLWCPDAQAVLHAFVATLKNGNRAYVTNADTVRILRAMINHHLAFAGGVCASPPEPARKCGPISA